ncbi:CD9-like protein [Mya arenaria]|uniref:CD9-like protein n=1 Tax=Mya arenaria TaxID=6604 RepID=A0ABY7E3D3_MYAAR|nr:CD9-like protein [Mya arenaria]WAR02929.1 CD9-like protein [Mya arenaria]
MAEGKLASCARYLLIILNLIFWITGMLLLGAGIWVVASDNVGKTVTEWLRISIPADTLMAVGYAVVGVGAFMFLIGFCGCCGAIRESAIMLGVGKCCGADNFTNYKENYYFKHDPKFEDYSVPDSCCLTYSISQDPEPAALNRCQMEARLGLVNGTQLFTKLIGVALAIYLCRNRSDLYDDDYYDD